MNRSLEILIRLILTTLKRAFVLGFFFVANIYSQEFQLELDSLENVYASKLFKKENELNILKKLAEISKDPNKILNYSNLLIEKAIEVDSTQYLLDANLNKGTAYRLKSDLSKALEHFLIAARIARDSERISDLALTNITIGDVYSIIGNYENSANYYENGIAQLRELINNPEKFQESPINEIDSETLDLNLATALLNAGDGYFYAGKYEKALGYFYESSALCKKVNYRVGSAYNLGNIGMVYAKQNKPKLAEANINEAIKILEEEKDYYPISVYLNYISEIYLDLNLPVLALDYSKRSLELAKRYQLKDEISDANLQLSKVYEQMNDPAQSLFHYKRYVLYKDSINNVSIVQKLANQRTEFEVSKKQIEVNLLTQKQKNERIVTYSFLGGLVLASGMAFGFYRRNRFISKTRKIIDEEREKSDNLLLNILPKETAEELKKSGKVEAKKYESVTVLFTDFKDFTSFAENSSPEKLVESVDMYFSEFDTIMAKYKLEKIKTIGDAYMCAGGLPEQTDNHAELMAQAALDILDFVKKSKQVYAVSDIRFDIRIGIHTGPVVAGVVGKNKFSYDIWGDTVNVASRIESSCEPGRISVSEDTYQIIKYLYKFENRGKISVKNRSPINMYYLDRK